MCFSLKSRELSDVGRRGRVELLFNKREGRTVLSDSFSTMPLYVPQPFSLDESGCAYTYLVNPAAGLAGGDITETFITLGEGAHAFITTPSATKVYRSLGEHSEQTTEILMRKGSVLEYLPGCVIPFAGSLYAQRMKVSMDGSSTVFLLDSFTSGRVARGEHILFREYKAATIIESEGRRLVTERVLLRPDSMDYSAIGLFESYSAAVVIYMIPGTSLLKERLAETLNLLHNSEKNLISGVSALPYDGVIVRLLCSGTVPLEKAAVSVWSVWRREILGCEAPAAYLRLRP